MKSYKSIINKKGLEELFYQVTFFAKKLWMRSVKPLVLAAGTSAGKTITSLIQLEIFYSIPENRKKITLILAASRSVLRTNFANALEQFNPSFSYYVVTNKSELEEAIKDGYQVIVCLPQTLNNNYKMLPKVTNFILDEAHQWYFKPTIQKIIKHCKPTRQLLLTGTPSRFIAKGDGFEFFFVPVLELYENGLVSNVKIEVVSSSYDFKQTDYLSSYGNLKSTKTNSPSKAKDAFSKVCEEMILKLRSKLGNKYLANVRGVNRITALFNDLQKTIIFCHSVKQANTIHKELSSMKGLSDSVLLSHSENDSDSENFELFRTDKGYKVLVAVDRGRLGYNLPDLFNVVDFTMTQSLDMIMQMLGRLLRLSDMDIQKVYYKVSTKNTSGYFVDLMTAVLCLFKMEWYSKFNGKNMGGIMIPKALTSKPKTKGKQSKSSSSKKSGTQQLRSLEELGIPMDLNFFNQSILYSQGDKFSTVAWTTLDEVRREFFEYTQLPKGTWTEQSVREEAKKHANISTFSKLVGAANRAKILGIYDEITAHMDRRDMKSRWTKELVIEEAKKYTSRTNFRKNSRSAYNWAEDNKLMNDVCAHMGKSTTLQWTPETIAKEAKKYKKRSEFKFGTPSAYVKAVQTKILDKVCSHMK
jgi:superfamily II DNA or RNA helicase